MSTVPKYLLQWEKLRVHEGYVITIEIIYAIFAIETLIIIRASIEHNKFRLTLKNADQP